MSNLFMSGETLVVKTDDAPTSVWVSKSGPAHIRIQDDTGLVRDIPSYAVGTVEFQGGDGNDTFKSYIDQPTRAYGFGGNDRLYGSLSRGTADTLVGGDGDDYLQGHGGHDQIYGGSGNDTMQGSIGNDYMVGGNGNDVIVGDITCVPVPDAPACPPRFNGNDTLIGGEGDDQIYGAGGHDSLWGQAGNDQIFGDSGVDQLVGGEGDDRLYGGAGSDSLYGQQGDDGLFGGGRDDYDYLYGGEGADRFLKNTERDFVLDQQTEDASIEFTNRTAGYQRLNGFGQIYFAAGSWTDSEIEDVDVALHNLHHHVSGTTLLKTRPGGEITFQRVGSEVSANPVGIGGWNDKYNSTIAYTDGAFRSDLWLSTVVYHEMGHNWDESSENPYIDEFRSLSGWTLGRPTVVDAIGQDITSMYYAKGKTGDWWHNNYAQFARDYGKYNPLEDYATTWETYFTDKYHDSLGDENNNQRVQAKYDNLDRFFASLA